MTSENFLVVIFQMRFHLLIQMMFSCMKMEHKFPVLMKELRMLFVIMFLKVDIIMRIKQIVLADVP